MIDQSAVVVFAPGQQALQQFLEHHLRRLGQIRAIAERLELFHVGALPQLQLHRMDVFGRVAVMPGDVAALETTVQHMAVVAVRRADGFQLSGQALIFIQREGAKKTKQYNQTI